MKNQLTKIFALGLIALQISGCGATTDNLDVLNSTNIPVLNSFASTPTYSSGSPFTNTNPFLIFSTTGFGSYLAPARGIVAEIGSSSINGFSGTNYITILHSGKVATRIHGIQVSNVRAGDVVAESSVVGTFFSSSAVALQVLLDGTSVCPLTFLSATVRQQLFANPCQ